MRVGCNAFPNWFSDLQTFFFKGVFENMTAQRPILKRFVAQTDAQTDSRPTNQRGNNTLAWGYDGSFRRRRLLFDFWALNLQAGDRRHIPPE